MLTAAVPLAAGGDGGDGQGIRRWCGGAGPSPGATGRRGQRLRPGPGRRRGPRSMAVRPAAIRGRRSRRGRDCRGVLAAAGIRGGVAARGEGRGGKLDHPVARARRRRLPLAGQGVAQFRRVRAKLGVHLAVAPCDANREVIRAKLEIETDRRHRLLGPAGLRVHHLDHGVHRQAGGVARRGSRRARPRRSMASRGDSPAVVVPGPPRGSGGRRRSWGYRDSSRNSVEQRRCQRADGPFYPIVHQGLAIFFPGRSPRGKPPPTTASGSRQNFPRLGFAKGGACRAGSAVREVRRR